ncbi:MAG: hypothetical protein JWO86_6021, partial [Myxococcaceae bacterium]|nr:hypothetical protein [Myxococcaceae bacterium]
MTRVRGRASVAAAAGAWVMCVVACKGPLSAKAGADASASAKADADADENAVLRLAAAVESGSEHPVGEAIVAEA